MSLNIIKVKIYQQSKKNITKIEKYLKSKKTHHKIRKTPQSQENIKVRKSKKTPSENTEIEFFCSRLKFDLSLQNRDSNE